MLNNLEKALGYEFRNKALLQNALTHTSYANEVYKDSLHSYERLEFLGDSILGFVAADFLYKTFPNKHEGELTRIRAELVCEQTLAAVAKEIGLGDALLLGHGESRNGGRTRASILCDVMESVLAAAYLDGGFDCAKGIVTRLILPRIAELTSARDYKTELQEQVQKKRDQILSYELLGESGPDHCKLFSVRVLLNGELLGQGEGTSKKRAEQAAAACALNNLNMNS